jgi:hypothetical protein
MMILIVNFNAEIPHPGRSWGVKANKRWRALTHGGFSLFLFPFSEFSYTFSAYTPVVGVDFINDNNRGGGVLVQNIHQELGCPLD